MLKKEANMMCYVGMDLHSNNTYVGLIDENGNRLLKGRFPNRLAVLLKVLEPYKENIKEIAVESTYNWYWLVDGLMEAGYQVSLAHPSGFQPYNGLKYSDDKSDSFFLARLLKLGILPKGHIYPKEERQVRDLLRKRLLLVRQRTMHILSFQSLVNRNNSLSLSSNDVKKLVPQDMASMFDDAYLIESAKANINMIRYLELEISRVERILVKKTSIRPEYKILLTVPGIGKYLALTIVLETGDIHRFKEAGNYASYCRAVESKRTTNTKSKGRNNRKNGNKYLAWAFLEAANFIQRYCPEAKEFYNDKSRKTHKVIAIKALANKISKACYYMLRDNQPFDVNRIFGKPQKLNQIKGSGSKPDMGTGNQAQAPIGKTAAISN